MEVPKFGSFKPKKRIVAEEDVKSSTREKKSSSKQTSSHGVDKRHHSREHHRRNDDGERERRRRDDRRHSQDREISPKHDHHRLKQAGNDQSLASRQHEREESDLFIIDRRGDAKNVEYGSLHRYSVPAYRRTGHGHLIGGPSWTKIDRESSTDKEVGLVSSIPTQRENQKVARLLSSKYGRSGETRLKFISPAEPEPQHDEPSDFIPLTSSKKRKRGADSPEIDGGVDYRSIEGKAKASNKPADEDVTYASDSDAAEHTNLDLRARQESALLSKTAKADPLNLDAWLALSKHQSQLIRPAVDPAIFTTSERTTLAELRLAILNQAGKHISPGKLGRERLLLALMEAGTPIWDQTKLAAKWGEVLKECPSSILLWTRYMDFVQYDYSSFHYDTCRDAYLKWLHILRTTHEQSSGEERTQISHTQIYALLRFTSFIRDAGYDELAIAIWQILLEFHFMLPKQLETSSLEARIESLEDYWDIETPRIGEEDAMTWAKFDELGPSHATPRPPITLHHDAPSTEEAKLTREFILPASTEHEDATVDPFRCVMFNDLRDVVECLSMNLPKRDLISAFLHFTGLPPLPHAESHTQAWLSDPHLAIVCDDIKIHSHRQTTLTLFQDAFEPFNNLHPSSSSTENNSLARFIDRVLQTLLTTQHLREDDILHEYHLAFKTTLFPPSAPKLAKTLLKSHPTNLRLYNAFALISARSNENLNKALQVWTAALTLLPKLPPEAQKDAILLWHSRFLTQISQQNEQTAMETLLTTIIIIDTGSETHNNPTTTTTQHLRLRRHLETKFDQMHLSHNFSHAILYSNLLAWLTYLILSPQDLQATLEIYNSHLTTLIRSGGSSAAVEELQQLKTHLLTHHLVVHHRPYTPSIIQKEKSHAKELFPNNSIFREISDRIEGMGNRLRSVLMSEAKKKTMGDESDDDDDDDDDDGVLIVEICYEFQREFFRLQKLEGEGNGGGGGGGEQILRAKFRKALLGPRGTTGRFCVGLWKAWMEFEVSRRSGDDEERKRRVREVWFEGLRALPGNLGWGVLGLRMLGMLGEGQRGRVLEGMVGRGLRVSLGGCGGGGDGDGR